MVGAVTVRGRDDEGLSTLDLWALVRETVDALPEAAGASFVWSYWAQPEAEA